MDAFNTIVKVPSWAYDFCFYYLAAAAVVVVYSLYSVVNLLMLPAAAKRGVPVTSLIIALLLSGLVSSVLVMMQFWICRSALRPANVEKFAAMCNGDADCVASAGAPQGSMCTCGGRGVCGGCKSQNSTVGAMEPVGMDF
jgi:hypothetical protein